MNAEQAGAGSRQGYRVLIAEDDFLIAEEVVRALGIVACEHLGTARNGRQAVEMVCALKPDVVLMDIQMPELDGLQAAEQIQQCQPTPIVILSAYETEEMVERATMLGVGAYLTKPPEPATIKRAIMVAVARHADLMRCYRLYQQLEMKNQQLQTALDEVRELKGILPICSFCKKIRSDEGYWEQLEHYIEARSNTEFSHGICPDCIESARAKWGLKPKD